MTRTAPEAARPQRQALSRLPAVASATALTAILLAGCAAPPPTGGAMSTTTLATTAGSVAGGSGPGVQPDVETGVPDTVVSFTGGAPSVTVAAGRPDEVRRGTDGDLLVVTWGSTTCPRMPVTVRAVDLTTVDIVTGTVRIGPAYDGDQVPETFVCTTDLGPTMSTVRLPEGAAGAGPLTVVVDGVALAVT